MNTSAKKELLLQTIGEIDQQYIQEYTDSVQQSRPRRRIRFVATLAAVVAILAGSLSIAAAFDVDMIGEIGHYFTAWSIGHDVAIQNYREIQSKCGVDIYDEQTCGGVTATLNTAVLEEHQLVLAYDFNWSGLEYAQDGSFHTYFLPWKFEILADNEVICTSDNTEGLHTQTEYFHYDEAANLIGANIFYTLDLPSAITGKELTGKLLTVRLLYSDDSGFSSSFTPTAYFQGQTWQLDAEATVGNATIHVTQVKESSLYLTLLMDCKNVEENQLSFLLSDESGIDYDIYVNDTSAENEYWFVKPPELGQHLTLKVVRNQIQTDELGEIIDDSYEVVCELPLDLSTSLVARLSALFPS